VYAAPPFFCAERAAKSSLDQPFQLLGGMVSVEKLWTAQWIKKNTKKQLDALHVVVYYFPTYRMLYELDFAVFAEQAVFRGVFYR